MSRGRVRAGTDEAQAQEPQFAPWRPCTTAFLADAPAVIPESSCYAAARIERERAKGEAAAGGYSTAGTVYG